MTGKVPVRTWDPAPLPPAAPSVRVAKTAHGAVPDYLNVQANGPKAKQCAECPWRVDIWGREDLHDYSNPEARETMWRGYGLPHNGLRDGSRMMSCHLGGPPSINGEPSSFGECAGAVVLLQRELLRYRAAPAAYDFDRGLSAPVNGARLGNRTALTPAAVENYAWHLFGLTVAELVDAPWDLIRERLHPGVTDPGIQHHELDAPTADEIATWDGPAHADSGAVHPDD